MRLLCFVFCLATLALWAGPVFAEGGIDVSLGANVVTQEPRELLELYYTAVNLGAPSDIASFTVTVEKGGMVLGSNQFEALLTGGVPLTESLQLPSEGSLAADVYLLRITASVGSVSDQAQAGIILDAENHIIAFGPPDPIVGVEQKTWGAIKGLYR